MYKTINGWTKEKMIETIMLKNNGTRSIDLNGRTCKYRGKNDNACAVGCFIPDQEYTPKMEEGVEILLEIYPKLLGFMPLSPNGLSDMQYVHDIDAKELNNPRELLIDWINKNVENN
jgi:hypothetical protein